jgi:hypothetical protein
MKRMNKKLMNNCESWDYSKVEAADHDILSAGSNQELQQDGAGQLLQIVTLFPLCIGC